MAEVRRGRCKKGVWEVNMIYAEKEAGEKVSR
jgi:hypothetical protein